MDLSLYLDVLWRSKRLLLCGLLLGAVLAVFTYAQPSTSGGQLTLKPRGAEVWQSESQLLITQTDFPYKASSELGTPPTSALAALSPIYAGMANGNTVQSEIRRQLGKVGTVKASEDIDAAATTLLPFVLFIAKAPTAAEATRLASGAARIFQSYVAHQQSAARIVAGQRVQLSIVQAASHPTLEEGHKLSIPILVFVAVLIAVLSLVFLRENARQHRAGDRREAPSEAREPLADAGPRPYRERGQMSTSVMHDVDVGVHREPVETSNA